jgi:hypothetical protein
MLLTVPIRDPHLDRAQIAAFSGYQGIPYRLTDGYPFGVSSRTFDSLRFGHTAYPLRGPLQGVFSPATGKPEGEFAVYGFEGMVVGEGRTPNGAFEDWVKRFHVAFQRLFAMRPFEMAAEDKRLWGVMQDRVDVERYRADRPLIVRQQGTVVKGDAFPQMIRWEDGTKERVPLERMPPEFATYKCGQPFEAVVHRDPITNKIRKVDFVTRLSARKKRTPEESERLWDSLPTSGALPDGDWK